jgi:hypothetical protein
MCKNSQAKPKRRKAARPQPKGMTSISIFFSYRPHKRKICDFIIPFEGRNVKEHLKCFVYFDEKKQINRPPFEQKKEIAQKDIRK